VEYCYASSWSLRLLGSSAVTPYGHDLVLALAPVGSLSVKCSSRTCERVHALRSVKPSGINTWDHAWERARAVTVRVLFVAMVIIIMLPIKWPWCDSRCCGWRGFLLASCEVYSMVSLAAEVLRRVKALRCHSWQARNLNCMPECSIT
jgi:hypothetical protein